MRGGGYAAAETGRAHPPLLQAAELGGGASKPMQAKAGSWKQCNGAALISERSLMVVARIAPNALGEPIEIFRNIAPDSAADLLRISAADLARLSHLAARRIAPKNDSHS